MKVMPAPVTCSLRIADQSSGRRRELVRCAVGVAGLPEPPDEIAATDAAGGPWAPTARNENRPTCRLQPPPQLAPRLAPAARGARARRQPGGAPGVPRPDPGDR